jgi:hypothetical protein
MSKQVDDWCYRHFIFIFLKSRRQTSPSQPRARPRSHS